MLRCASITSVKWYSRRSVGAQELTNLEAAPGQASQGTTQGGGVYGLVAVALHPPQKVTKEIHQS